MSEYWKNHFNANVEKFPDSPLKQVERTMYGRELDQSQIDLIVHAIVENLYLSKSDVVADICCGNGVITKIIAKLSKHVIGVDFSENLINHTQLISAQPNIEYIVSNVVALSDDFFSRPTKMYMQDAIQCMNAEDFLKLLKKVSQSPQLVLFFVAGVPDLEKLNIFYDSDEKLTFYRQREAAGEPHIGTWWSKSEVNSLVESVGLKASFIPQNPHLYTAHYRYDCLIEKK